jgi:hypothetical protein
VRLPEVVVTNPGTDSETLLSRDMPTLSKVTRAKADTGRMEIWQAYPISARSTPVYSVLNHQKYLSLKGLRFSVSVCGAA